MNVFELANSLLTEKRDWEKLSEQDKKAFNSFMVIKFMGMNKDLCVLMNSLQDVISLDSKTVYNIIKENTPKEKKYLAYINKTGKKDNEELISYIAKFYECSLREAKDYLSLLGKEDLKEILLNFSLDDKEIAKILK
jgi:hypothetical protein